jgi:hypothetical protein
MTHRLSPPLSLALLLPFAALASAQGVQPNFAGSVQLDYLAVPTEPVATDLALDGATAELSLKVAVDFSRSLSSSVKVCFACHGFEVGAAHFDMRVSDALNFRVGRFTPSFGEFPLRHDPANHRTNDKPLPYDMGRMLHLREWNMSILPAPWVDNGIEIQGSHFVSELSQIGYALHAVSGPRASAEAVDFDFIQSRTPSLYYVDNNSRPALGARAWASIGFGPSTQLSLGSSAMYGTYDPDNELEFWILGADAVLRTDPVTVRAEYLLRRTEMSLGEDPDSRFRYTTGPDRRPDGFFLKDGFYGEVEVPWGRVDLVARWDGLRRLGNVVQTSALRSKSLLLRYTAAMSIRVEAAMRIKISAELYDASDFEDEVAIHVGVASAF